MFRMAVIGTSISWGQGLDRDETFARLLASDIARLRNEAVNLESYAHSGARIWRGDLAARPLVRDAPRSFAHCLELARAMTPAPQWPGSTPWREWVGECPDGEPYLWLQALECAHDHGDAGNELDLVVLDAGANDVDFMKAINPTADFHTPTRNLSGALAPLLCALRRERACARAPILVAGYYRAFSPRSSISYAPTNAGMDWFWHGALGAIDHAMLGTLAARCDDWTTRMHNLIRTDVAAANAHIGGAPFAHFVNPSFPHGAAMWTAEEGVWGPDSAGGPRDHATQRRVGPTGVCPQRTSSTADRFSCERASFGHPTPRGARLYRDALLGACGGLHIV